ncbi:MAG TPA: uroporphyrinogen-III C-methyltransferase [Terriglobales bacterium]|jgi:uroporphyrin-III C-methyltransferase|nr:uroporphyrinogen-III C-methyltransferase [Terriglobales bacterium]
MPGKVFLVGAGPGDPELLTLKALKVLRNADVVLHDDLVSAEILKLIPATAQVQNIGKRCGRKGITQQEINTLLVNYALLDRQVVRLKGGDPLIFGRAGEEIEALRNARIEFEIVPGITAAFGAAAAAQIPLTHRDASSALVLITNHQANHPSTHGKSDWPASLPANATIVVYMPGYGYEATGQKLIQSGLDAATPCAIISHATGEDQQVFQTNIHDLANAPHLPAPTLLVVGEVARFASDSALAQFSLLVPASVGPEFRFENLQQQESSE